MLVSGSQSVFSHVNNQIDRTENRKKYAENIKKKHTTIFNDNISNKRHCRYLKGLSIRVTPDFAWSTVLFNFFFFIQHKLDIIFFRNAHEIYSFLNSMLKQCELINKVCSVSLFQRRSILQNWQSSFYKCIEIGIKLFWTLI